MGLALLKCCYNPPVAPSELLAQTSRNKLQCISCGNPFTISRRKRRCNYCNGHFCKNCIVAENEGFVCGICNILKTSAPDRSELMKQRVRHIQRFLAYRHISTAACTEKEELVDLILSLHPSAQARRIEVPPFNVHATMIVDEQVDVETTRENDEDVILTTQKDFVAEQVAAESTKNFVDLDVQTLTVRQLKEALTRNFVTYKGCCEKTELVERAKRLQEEMRKNNGQASVGVPEDLLCKICMDAMVDCVLLECGHMLTCTPCGKVLSECPVCRQYVVRVVHIFRS